MTLNFPGPNQLRIYYTVDAGGLGNMSHVLQLNFDTSVSPTPGDAFADIDVLRRDAGANTLANVTDALVALLVPLFDVEDATLDYAECWDFVAGTFDARYISSYTIGEAGTSAGAAIPAAQTIYSFRTLEGGSMLVSLMESNTSAGASAGYADINQDNKDFVDFMIHVANASFLGRDTSYPVAFTRIHPGVNEALFKARYR